MNLTDDTMHIRRGVLLVVALGLLLAASVAAYLQGVGGRWMFDDAYSLEGLSNVTDAASGLNYVRSGHTGPGGRPLALATFLANASDWPADPAAFRYVNIAIHLANGALLYWLMLMVMPPGLGSRATWAALTAAGLWLLSPFLASSVLSVVQRMSLLSGTFVLLGLIGYIGARKSLSDRPWRALLGMSAALGAGTLAAFLAKENGALLPILAGVFELSFPAAAPGARTRKVWLAWRLVFFLGPLLLLGIYLASQWPSILRIYRSRPFTLEQRLLTEPVILWDYVRNLLLPRISGFGLFHDDYPALDGSSVLAWVAMVAWAALGALSVALRRRLPWLFFAVAGFLAGHLLESTVFPLEFYFEHRNYVAAVFVYGSVAIVLWQGIPGVAPIVAALTLAASGLLLAGVTTLWGNSAISAEMWYRAHPDSPRAIQFVVQQRIFSGHPEAARQAMVEAAQRLPTKSDILLESLQMQCSATGGDALRAKAQVVAGLLSHAERSYAAIESVGRIQERIDAGTCAGLSMQDVSLLAAAMAGNPQFLADPMAMDHLYNFLAHNALQQGAVAQAEDYQRLAYRSYPSADNALALTVNLLMQNKTSEAIGFLRRESEQHAKQLGFRRDDWDARVGVMLKALEKTTGRPG